MTANKIQHSSMVAARSHVGNIQMKIRKHFVLLAVVAMAAWSLPASAVTNTLQVFDHDFGVSPATHIDPTIHVGDTIQWVWISGFHSTTAAAGQLESWDSGQHPSPFTFFHTFTQVGVFNYYCSIHGFDAGGGSVGGMSGHITVLTAPPPPGHTPPQLNILSPVDYQTVTDAEITVTGTVSDASGVQSVTVNTATATLNSTNWSQLAALSLGTNIFTVIATDSSPNANASTQTVHAVRSTVLAPPGTNNPPVITAGPAVTNALLMLMNSFVVAVGDTNLFDVSAIDPAGAPLSYQWQFGDGTTNPGALFSTTTYVYPTNTDCGPHLASVTVNNGTTTMSSNLTVIVACRLTVIKLQATVNFAKLSNDTCSVTGTLDLGGVDPANQMLVLDIGGAQQMFQLDSKGRGIAVILDNKQRRGGVGTCRLTFTKPTAHPMRPGFWTLAAVLSKGTWRDPWNKYGLVNTTILPTANSSVTLPVTVVIGQEVFAAEKALLYQSKAGKTGTAK